MLQDSSPSKNRPSYFEAVAAIQEIELTFPDLDVQEVLHQLHYKINIEKNHKLLTILNDNQPQLDTTNKYHSLLSTVDRQKLKQLIIESYIQIGYGFSNFLNYIKHQQEKQIAEKSNLKTLYGRIINSVLIDGFLHQQNIAKKTQSPDNNTIRKQLKKAKMVLPLLRNCKKYLSMQNQQTWYKILQANNISQHNIQKLHQALKQLHQKISQNELEKDQLIWQEASIYSQSQTDQYSNHQQLIGLDIEQLRKYLVQCYLKNPSFTYIKERAISQFQQLQLVQKLDVQQELNQVIEITIRRLKQQQEIPQCLAQGNKFKRLVKIDPQTVNMIMHLPEASEVRDILFNFYLLQNFDLNDLTCSILSVNQFVNKKQNEAIQLSLKRSKANNSISRQEYAFEGKRRKVLVLKRQYKRKNKV